jgi:hypothetical protein
MEYLKIAGYVYAFLFVTYVFYLAMMAALRAYKDPNTEISLYAKLFIYPMIVIFLALDWTLNTIMSVFYLEIPKRAGELFTDRLTRWHDNEGYRGKFSRWFAHAFLDDYDPNGVHVPGKGH